MRWILPVEVLALLAVAALVPRVCEGRVLSKCELKSLMEAAELTRPERLFHRITFDDLMAKIICHVELSSGFNTSAVTQFRPEDAHSHGKRRRRREAGGSAIFALAMYMNQSSEESRVERPDVWTLYGLFTLSDHVVCQSGSAPSLNLCDMDCNDLTNDDITDDIACVETIKTKMMDGSGEEHGSPFTLLSEMIALLYQRECASVVASVYFADCE